MATVLDDERVQFDVIADPLPEENQPTDAVFLLEIDDTVEQPAGNSLLSNIAGTGISVAFHLWLILTFAGITLHQKIVLTVEPIDARLLTTDVVEQPDEVIEYELAIPDDKDLKVQPVLLASSFGMSQNSKPKIEQAPVLETEFRQPNESRPFYDIPEGMEIDDRLVVKGNTGEGLIHMESALDRVTWEIAQNMQERRVLVVWLVDGSGSLTKQRQAIASRLKRIYGELEALQKTELIPRLEEPLLSSVVSFGERTNFLIPEPTADFQTIQNALNNVPVDESGVENVFTAVGQVVSRWSKYRTERGRRIMIITVTDESGDDYEKSLELSIARAKHYGAKVYVIGPSAVFGRRTGFVPYRAPENGKMYRLPVDIGPESVVISQVPLPFWFNGPQYEYLSSGFGPYALTRLVRETGGVYFMTNMTTTTGLTPFGTYDPQALKPYQPIYDYASPKAYMKMLNKYPLRKAVVLAARMRTDEFIEQNLKGTPRLDLRVQSRTFKRQLSDIQKSVAQSTFAVESLLQAFPSDIEKYYDQEPSLRWRMTFNLAYGRLLAHKVRCYEYNFACAHLKNTLSTKDVETKVNHFIFRPDKQLNFAPQAKRSFNRSREYLQRILDEAPGTPWALLAAREMKDPLGMRVIQRFIPPPPPVVASANPATPKKKPQFAPNQRPNQTTKRPVRPPKPKLPKL